jgi:hypothetical protein
MMDAFRDTDSVSTLGRKSAAFGSAGKTPTGTTTQARNQDNKPRQKTKAKKQNEPDAVLEISKAQPKQTKTEQPSLPSLEGRGFRKDVAMPGLTQTAVPDKTEPIKQLKKKNPNTKDPIQENKQYRFNPCDFLCKRPYYKKNGQCESNDCKKTKCNKYDFHNIYFFPF